MSNQLLRIYCHVAQMNHPIKSKKKLNQAEFSNNN